MGRTERGTQRWLRKCGVGGVWWNWALQELVAPELSFVLHTAHPLSRDPNLLVAEIAVGHGETLASGMRGTPWRLQVHKTTGEVTALALANMSEALMVDESGDANGKLVKVKVDYSAQPL